MRGLNLCSFRAQERGHPSLNGPEYGVLVVQGSLAENPRQPQRAIYLLARAVLPDDRGEGVEERPDGGRSELGVVEVVVELDDPGELRGRQRPAGFLAHDI